MRRTVTALVVAGLLGVAGCTSDDVSPAAESTESTSVSTSGEVSRARDRFSKLWLAADRARRDAGWLGQSVEELNEQLSEDSPVRFAEVSLQGVCLENGQGSYLFETPSVEGPLTLLGDGECSHDLDHALVAMQPTDDGRTNVFRGRDLLNDRVLGLLGVGGRSKESVAVADAVAVSSVIGDEFAASGRLPEDEGALRDLLARRMVGPSDGRSELRFYRVDPPTFTLCIVDGRSGAWGLVRQGTRREVWSGPRGGTCRAT